MKQNNNNNKWLIALLVIASILVVPIIICMIIIISIIAFSFNNNSSYSYMNISNIIENNVVEEQQVVEIPDTTNKISLKEIPEYSDMPYVEINNNTPFFDDLELTTKAFENYSDLDNLGRVGIAYACIEKGMDDQPRESISKITPTGWKDNQYDDIDGKNLYNRCHLIANQLTGENNNEKNLITGTRYMNTQGMERFENQVAEYIKSKDNHVLYRVTPMFDSENLLASGVLIEAKSVEDKGEGLQFCVFCYNVQPGIEIEYKTGDNKRIEETKNETQNNISEENTTSNNTTIPAVPVAPSTTSSSTSSNSSNKSTSTTPKETASPSTTSQSSTSSTYILNTNTKKFHHPWCSSVNKMSNKNKQTYNGTREGAIKKGYTPCQRCNP